MCGGPGEFGELVCPRCQAVYRLRFRARTGVPWRDVPAEYGPWGRGYDLFRQWQRNDTWRLILTRLQSLADAAGAIVWDLSVGSAVCGAHQHAAGAGSVETGSSSNRYWRRLVCPASGRDGRVSVPIGCGPTRAYASRKNRAYLRRRGIRCTIPEKPDHARNRQQLGSRSGRPPRFDPADYRERHAV
ncbi:hypothetical protein GCM10012285_37350 [Streptomyces kronopolitis]|uniref:Insertion element IS402-like domain-containing protein n=1 Tax=Streptomyces kronopolitis TaxID=1612435 RepID=A0ABQ2JL00_9ACTN|nr:transposase [Streptomyces kronopolitis]GGN49333.1 hypothetical protein GCM10012285_37350 [Streptomyces kronopolitis]